jgi:hypothetical protein
VRPQSGVESVRCYRAALKARREVLPESGMGEGSGVSRSRNLRSCLSDSLSYQSVVGQGRATGGSPEDEAEEFVPSANLVGFATIDVFDGSQTASTMPPALPALLAALRSLLWRRAAGIAAWEEADIRRLELGLSQPRASRVQASTESRWCFERRASCIQNATRETDRTKLFSIGFHFSLDPRNAWVC